MLTVAKNEAKTTAKVVASKKTAKPVKVIYIGPSVRRVAAKNTVYSNGLTPMLEAFCEKYPVAKTLIVPVSELAEARAQLKASNSALRNCYEKLENELKEKEED